MALNVRILPPFFRRPSQFHVEGNLENVNLRVMYGVIKSSLVRGHSSSHTSRNKGQQVKQLEQLRAQFLDRIKEAFDAQPNLENLLLYPYFQQAIEKAQESWRAVIMAATHLGLPAPAFTTALAYYDSYRLPRLPANLLQAQRDYFGAHTYQRLDKAGTFHSEWLELRKKPE